MINQLLHQLAARAEDNPRTARRHPTEPAGLFATELKKQLIGSEHQPARDAEADSIDEALRREVKATASARDREVTLTDLLLEGRGAVEDEAAAFEDERTAPEVPHLRSSGEQLASAPRRGQPGTMFEERLREQALARFTGDASSTSRQAMVRAGGVEAEHKIPIIGQGAAQSLEAAVDRAAREHHPTKPIRQGLLNPPPPSSKTGGASAVVGSQNARPVALRADDAQRWAAPQVVSTIDKTWKPQASGQDGAEAPAMHVAAPAAEHQPTEALTADAVAEASEMAGSRAFDQTLRHVVEGERALAAQTGASATTSAMRAVVDQVRSLMDGLGLEGQLRLRTDGAEVQVQSDTLGTLAARIGVNQGVVDLTLSGQAAASLTAELDALKQMLVEAGLTVGDVKTSTLPSGEQHAQGRGGRDQEQPEPRSGSAVATEEGQAREASRARRRSHHGQVNVSA